MSIPSSIIAVIGTLTGRGCTSCSCSFIVSNITLRSVPNPKGVMKLQPATLQYIGMLQTITIAASRGCTKL
ncbi:MAG: hypothetical protein AAFP83_18165 [Bacteroidota bacterium]